MRAYDLQALHEDHTTQSEIRLFLEPYTNQAANHYVFEPVLMWQPAIYVWTCVIVIANHLCLNPCQCDSQPFVFDEPVLMLTLFVSLCYIDNTLYLIL